MIHIIVNDLSFQGQARDEGEATILLRTLALALNALRTQLGASSVHRPRGMKDALITANLRLGAFLSAASMRKDERDILLTQLTRGPYLGSGTGSNDITLPPHQCHCHNQPMPDSVVAHAAYLSIHEPFFGTHRPTALLSLGCSSGFQDEELVVQFILSEKRKPVKAKERKAAKQSGRDNTNRTIWNVTREQQVYQVRRRYKANSGKHATDDRLDGYISAMPLSEDRACQVLAEGVLLPKETRIFGKHEGKYYIFPCHDKHNNEFHGFCITEKDLRSRLGDVHAQLKKLGFFD